MTKMREIRRALSKQNKLLREENENLRMEEAQLDRKLDSL